MVMAAGFSATGTDMGRLARIRQHARATFPSPARLLVWTPVAMGAGAAAYFSLSAEPPEALRVWLWLSAVCLLALAVIARHRSILLCTAILSAFALIGFAAAQGRAMSAAPAVSVEPWERARTVEGWIERVERSGSRERVLVRVSALQGAEAPPRRVRVVVNRGELRPGDGVRLRAVLSSPRGPRAPGGYDAERASWFQGVALTGFAVAVPEPATVDGERMERGFLQWRWDLAERLRASAGERTGGIIAALLTGDRSGIENDDAEALRMSGLGHILAISGLHMALVAGGIYFAARWLFAAIDPFARAHDPRKPAALIALLAGAGYLILSGAGVPTQRAFVMVAVVMAGVLLDRRGISMQSLAIAALIVLALAPESVVMVGFQMSFAATAALIAVYEMWRRHGPQPLGPKGVMARFGDWALALFITSLVAGAATGAFAVFHFQRMAIYGLGANMLAMPVFTLWVMPFSVVGLIAAPLGLEGPFLWVADKGMGIVLDIAHQTSALPGAAVPAIAAPGFVVAIYGLGFTFLTVGQGMMRAAGLAVLASAYAVWAFQPPPHLMVTESGVVVARFGEDEAFTVTDRRRGRFDAGIFLQRAGAGNVTPERASLACDSLGCTGVTREGLRVSVADSAQALEDDCDMVDMVVIRGRVSQWQRRRCAALVLDETARAELGGIDIWIRDGRISRARAAYRERGDRLWTR